MRLSASAWKTLARVWVWAFLAICVLIPMGTLLTRASGGVGLFSPEVLSVAGLTLKQAMLSVFFSILLGVPLAVAVGARPGRMTRAVLAIPYTVPTVVVATALILWLGRSGVLAAFGLQIEWTYTLKAVVLAHVALNTPWVALMIADARAQLPDSQIDAAKVLGACRFQRALWIEWPYVKWALASSAAQVFSVCVMSFALVLLLGGGPPVETLETSIYSKIRFGTLDLPAALAFAFWELLICLAPWGLLLVFQRMSARLPSTPARLGKDSPLGLLLAGAWIAIYGVLFWYTPASAWRSAPWSEQILPALWVSLRLAFCAATFAVVTACAGLIAGGPARGSRVVTALLSLPSGISVLVLGLGFWLAYQDHIDPFEGSFAAIFILHGTVALPFVLRMLWPLVQGSQLAAFDAARTLGASPGQAFRAVEWPRWRGPLLGAWVMAMGASIGEVAAVSLFYSEDLVPLPLLLARASAQYRFEDAQVLGCLLLLLSAGIVTWVQSMRWEKPIWTR